MTFNPRDIALPGAKIKVIGIGGGGGNAVNTMIRSNIEGVEFIAANTDIQSLQFSLASHKIQVGKELTRGLGAGADPDVGRDAALEDRHAIQEALEGANMVFVTAGMGGGTGTGGASVVAQIARELGALTVGVVTKPFGFEGKRRMRHAEIGISRLQEHVDTLITIPNQRLLQVASPDLTMIDAFRMADNVLVNAVRGISDIINVPGTVNVDFADVKTVMSSMGRALMGIGVAEGDDRAVNAAIQAICSPLLEDIDIEGATGILINITAGSDITLMEVNQACSIVQEAAHEDCNIIFGAVIDENMGRAIRVTVIATGFPADEEGEKSVPPKDMLVKESVRSLYQSMKLPDPRPHGAQAAAKPLVKAPQAAARPLVTHQPVKAPEPAAPVAPKSSFVPKPEAPMEVTPLPEAISVEPVLAAVVQPEISQLEAPAMTAEEELLMAEMEAEEAAKAAAAQQAAEVEEFVLERTIEPELKLEGASAAKAFEAEAPVATEQLDEDIFSYLDNSEATGSIHEVFRTEPSNQPVQSLEDQRIDEALELADRISHEKEQSKQLHDDELDVPAFLRNGMKDLSLS